MRTFQTLTGALALTGLAACVTTGQTAAGAIDPGCYYFTQDSAAAHLNLPWGIRLLEAPLEGWPAFDRLEDVRTATTLTGRDEADHPFSYWRPVQGDSVLIGYPRGGGVSLRVVRTEDGLVGVAQPVGDATLAQERPTYAVRLLRARCPEDL